MDRFVSHHVLRLDAKGRVSVPAPFRAVLARDGFDGLYCYPAFDRPALDAGGNALLAEIETLIAGFSPFSEQREQFSLALYGSSETLKIDGEGRVVLSECSQELCGDQRGCRVCWSRPQIPDLGARPVSRGTDGGHREGSRVQTAIGIRDGGTKTAGSTGMMAGSDSNAVAGGLARHIPVLARRAVEWLGVHEGGVYVDATFGAGGYSRMILATPGARVIGIDRDQTAVAKGATLVSAADGRLDLIEDRFSNLEAVVESCGVAAVDGVVFDLGVSSMQLDEAVRGFSFRFDGPLDMRMGHAGPSAADVVAHASARDLAAIIGTLGEERHARAIARAIAKAREAQPIATTRALADVVGRVVHAREGMIHPATRTFQALRIFVNDELAELARGLAAAPNASSSPKDVSSWSLSTRSRIASSKTSLPSEAARRRSPATGRRSFPPRRRSAC